MFSLKAQYNLRNAKEYFEEHLDLSDYYSEGQKVAGEWHGKGVEMLGFSGVTHGEEFVRLCENLHPQTGERLTLRHKTIWWESRVIMSCFLELHPEIFMKHPTLRKQDSPIKSLR